MTDIIFQKKDCIIFNSNSNTQKHDSMWSIFHKSDIHTQFRLFLIASCLWGFAASTGDAIFNNYLDETFTISDFQRSIIEVPRETPGLIVVFVAALFSFLCSRRLAALAMLFCGAGTLLLASFTPGFGVMLAWLFILSVGQHLLIPTTSAIGMELAKEGETGKRLGQINGAKNFATILGSFAVFLGFKYLHFSFSTSFLLATAGYLLAAFFLFRMTPVQKQPASLHLRFYKEYNLYYWLCILFGARKQIFLTFAPWVLVTEFKLPTTMLATLLTIGGVIGIGFQPLIGRCIDKIGEKAILASEAFVLIFVCMGYGLSKSLFSKEVAVFVVCTCYMMDQLLMSVGMARATYLKKIAIDKSHITPTLTMATSIDHVFSISGAVICGFLWKAYGYQVVFFVAAFIALINLFSALRIKTDLDHLSLKRSRKRFS